MWMVEQDGCGKGVVTLAWLVKVFLGVCVCMQQVFSKSWWKNFPGRGVCEYKGPEVGLSLPQKQS